MDRIRPNVTHAGCGGQVIPGEDGRPVCQACRLRITDPQELNARGSGFRPERRVMRDSRIDRVEA